MSSVELADRPDPHGVADALFELAPELIGTRVDVILDGPRGATITGDGQVPHPTGCSKNGHGWTAAPTWRSAREERLGHVRRSERVCRHSQYQIADDNPEPLVKVGVDVGRGGRDSCIGGDVLTREFFRARLAP